LPQPARPYRSPHPDAHSPRRARALNSTVADRGPGLSRDVDNAFFRGAEDDATATETFGRRYNFARLNQTTVSANIRLNWAFTPTISLQTFLQPLISAGDYTDYKSLARPRSYEFDPYPYPDIKDFNFKSLRGNAVFRWEYMPGSTLFLVWTQERTDFQPTGEFDFRRNFDALTSADANNIFLAKLTYYFSL